MSSIRTRLLSAAVLHTAGVIAMVVSSYSLGAIHQKKKTETGTEIAESLDVSAELVALTSIIRELAK